VHQKMQLVGRSTFACEVQAAWSEVISYSNLWVGCMGLGGNTCIYNNRDCSRANRANAKRTGHGILRSCNNSMRSRSQLTCGRMNIHVQSLIQRWQHVFIGLVSRSGGVIGNALDSDKPNLLIHIYLDGKQCEGALAKKRVLGTQKN
jgi:hypothetical protein